MLSRVTSAVVRMQQMTTIVRKSNPRQCRPHTQGAVDPTEGYLGALRESAASFYCPCNPEGYALSLWVRVTPQATDGDSKADGLTTPSPCAGLIVDDGGWRLTSAEPRRGVTAIADRAALTAGVHAWEVEILEPGAIRVGVARPGASARISPNGVP